MDNLSLERGRTPEETRQKPRKKDLALDGRITAVVQARKDPSVLYARTVSRGLLKSQDRGETWRQVRGLPFRGPNRVTVDPRDHETIWVSTFGGGIWRGPAMGTGR